MITVHIDEYVNGFGLKVYDSGAGLVVNEIFEERLQLLKRLISFFQDEAELRRLNAPHL